MKYCKIGEKILSCIVLKSNIRVHVKCNQSYLASYIRIQFQGSKWAIGLALINKIYCFEYNTQK